MPPETRYAKSGDLNIAYQVVGQGPLDLIWVPGWVSNVETGWELPELAHFLDRLGSFSRLIRFDKRGTGLSDRVPNDRLPMLEERMDDLRAVMDAAGSERAAILGHSEGGSMCVLFAAAYPERTAALVTIGVFAKRIRSDDYPWAPTAEERERVAAEVEQGWGEADLEYYAPSRVGDEDFARELARFFRSSASPGAAAALIRMNSQIDVRGVLPVVRVPTLMLHAVGDRDVNIEEARYMAARIPDAKLVEFASSDHAFWASNADKVADEIEEFLTGFRPAPELDRVLATVLFTDIVGSTRKAAELGDHRWRELLFAHDAAVRRELQRFRGREVDTAGDGFLATFDGPARAVRCAVAVREAIRPLGLEIRAGVHTGECELVGEKVRGIAVHTGARIASLGGPGEVLASSTVKDLVAGSGIEFEDRGAHELRDVPDEWRLFAVTS